MKGEILLHLVWQTADLPMIGVPSTTWIPDETPPLVQKLMISRKRREKGRKRAMQGKRKHNPAGKILQWASWDSKNAYTIRKKRIVKKDNKEPLWRTYHCHQFQLGTLLPQSNSSTLDSTAIRKCPQVPTNGRGTVNHVHFTLDSFHLPSWFRVPAIYVGTEQRVETQSERMRKKDAIGTRDAVKEIFKTWSQKGK